MLSIWWDYCWLHFDLFIFVSTAMFFVLNWEHLISFQHYFMYLRCQLNLCSSFNWILSRFYFQNIFLLFNVVKLFACTGRPNANCVKPNIRVHPLIVLFNFHSRRSSPSTIFNNFFSVVFKLSIANFKANNLFNSLANSNIWLSFRLFRILV